MVYGEINDAAAISLYMLTPPVRRAWTPVPWAGCFAKLCGREGSLYHKWGRGWLPLYYDCIETGN